MEVCKSRSGHSGYFIIDEICSHKKASSEPDIDDIIEKHFAECNIVLSDGFTLSDKPRIIVKDREEDIEVFKRGCEVVAVIAKNVGREDIPGLANIVARFCSLD